MHAIRDFKLSCVSTRDNLKDRRTFAYPSVVEGLFHQRTPSLHNFREDAAASILCISVGHWPRNRRVHAVEVARIRCVEVHITQCWLACPLANLVLGLVRYKLVHISADIPAAQRVEIPVRLDGSNFGVVVVVIAIRRSHKMLWNCITKENPEDVVLDSVGVVFIEGDQDQSVLHEVLII